MSDEDKNVDLGESKAPELYGITFSLLGVTIVVVALRLYCRLRIVKKMQNSDYLIMAAMALLISMSGMIHMQIQTGMGRHRQWSDERPHVFRLSMKAGYSENILYQAAVGFVKASILTQYLYIASSLTQRRVIKWMLAFVVVACVVITLMAIFMCVPISAAFDYMAFHRRCWNLKEANYATSSINAATDVAIFLLPLPILAKLTMEKRKKVMLLGVFSLGSIAIIASAARLSNIGRWANGDDFTYDAAMVPVWGAVEINVAIVSASIPLLKPIFRRLFPFLHNSHRSAASLAVQESWNHRRAEQNRDPLDWDWDSEANPLASPTAMLAEDKCSSAAAAVAAAATAGLSMSAVKSSSMSTCVSKPAPAATTMLMESAVETGMAATDETETGQVPESTDATDIDAKDKAKSKSISTTGDSDSVYIDARATTQHVEDVEKVGNVEDVSLLTSPAPMPSPLVVATASPEASPSTATATTAAAAVVYDDTSVSK